MLEENEGNEMFAPGRQRCRNSQSKGQAVGEIVDIGRPVVEAHHSQTGEGGIRVSRGGWSRVTTKLTFVYRFDEGSESFGEVLGTEAQQRQRQNAPAGE